MLSIIILSSLNLPFLLSNAGNLVDFLLADGIISLEVLRLARPSENIVIDHVQEERSTEEAFSGEQVIDLILFQ